MKVSQIVKQQRKAWKRRLKIARQKIAERKRRFDQRIKHKAEQRYTPMFRAGNIQFEIADRTHAICYGGLGLMQSLDRQCGLIDAIDRNLHLLKIHFPYHESDHVVNIAYNSLTDGKCLEDLELKRRDEACLDALGTPRIPDPTTAGDFCRRFQSDAQIEDLQRAISIARANVWRRQPDDFFEQAAVDMDGSIVGTTGECKQGMDIAYKEKADDLDESAWQRLHRPPPYEVHTRRRKKPKRVKEQIVVERGFKNIVLQSENVAELEYSPTACRKTYRMILVRKNLSVEKGENVLFDDIRYFFYITNDRASTAEEIVFSCNDRCHQDSVLLQAVEPDVIEQLKNGPRAFRAPLDNLHSNWAYMLMASLAWTLKAWSALWLPETGRWKDRRRADKYKLLRMEFRTFVNTLIRIPCQIVKTGRRLVYRVLSGNDSQPVFWRLADVLEL